MAKTLLLWAWIPLCWQPLWGQAPGIRVNPGHKPQQQSKLTAGQTESDQRGTQNSPLVVDVLSHPKDTEESAKEKNEKDRAALIDGWTLGFAGAAAGFTGLLVIIGGRGVHVALRTLVAIEKQANLMERQTTVLERQTKAIEDTAVAAKGQIEAVIAESRPWLLIDKIEKPYLTPAFESPQGQARFAHCIVATKNHGKTPAKIMAMWSRLLISDSPVIAPVDLDAVEVSLAAPRAEPYIFPPGDLRTLEVAFPDGFILPQDRDDVLSNKVKYLWLCGFVKYMNTFDNELRTEYETRFCYVYETRLNSPEPFWTPAGPPKCNRAT
jgi:hypothetical protein